VAGLRGRARQSREPRPRREDPRPADRPGAFDQLTNSPSGITPPPWETEGADGYLPAAEGASGGENTTEPLAPQVIGPLLVWAIRVVEDLSDDILAAWAENRR